MIILLLILLLLIPPFSTAFNTCFFVFFMLASRDFYAFGGLFTLLTTSTDTFQCSLKFYMYRTCITCVNKSIIIKLNNKDIRRNNTCVSITALT